ncbi:hypothetical protein EYF80_042754 [Liparis tanakae]|uniref:Uncharacterized protein n=1 Tax=Liparis tanakae TaxID=230148 RepID=A0A4Z2G1P5_9TELE|nr:hypothetical protein EYF80_042754 [Liparis tanakae]
MRNSHMLSTSVTTATCDEPQAGRTAIDSMMMSYTTCSEDNSHQSGRCEAAGRRSRDVSAAPERRPPRGSKGPLHHEEVARGEEAHSTSSVTFTPHTLTPTPAEPRAPSRPSSGARDQEDLQRPGGPLETRRTSRDQEDLQRLGGPLETRRTSRDQEDL